MFCKNCGCELAEEASFCPQCGTPVAASSDSVDYAQPNEDTYSQAEPAPEPEAAPLKRGNANLAFALGLINILFIPATLIEYMIMFRVVGLIMPFWRFVGEEFIYCAPYIWIELVLMIVAIVCFRQSHKVNNGARITKATVGMILAIVGLAAFTAIFSLIAIFA